MRQEHENELLEMKQKMELEQRTKAQMQSEIEAMKREYEDKLKDLENRAERAKTASRSQSVMSQNVSVKVDGTERHLTVQDGVALSESGNFRRPFNDMQIEAKEK